MAVPRRKKPTRKSPPKEKIAGAVDVQCSILDEANMIVNGPRAEDYGDAKVNFTRWRNMCRATGRPDLENITAESLAVVMICLKVCRNTKKYKRDSTVDGAGYFELWDRVEGL